MADTGTPIFGFILFGGSLSGALVRDMRLANELADRGYGVHVWWAMDRPANPPLRPAIVQHDWFNGFRYYRRRGRWLHEQIGRAMCRIWSDAKRARSLQKRPDVGNAIMQRYLTLIADGVERDRPVLDRFVRQLNASGVTHMLPMLAALGAYLEAARPRLRREVKQLVTFQGYELYVNYARAARIEPRLYHRLRGIASASDWPAIAVSRDYCRRVIDDIGVPADRLTAIHPGVPTQRTIERDAAANLLADKLRGYDPQLPLISYLGRQDVEKGIDLLLYAANLLRRAGKRFQLAIAGPTLFGESNARVIRGMANDLRLPVIWQRHVSDELRNALFAASRVVVYPPIHREPFGMVPVEAAAYGTPAVVPDHGGITEAIRAGESPDAPTAGLTFGAWDSGDLAEQVGRLLDDEALWRRLSDAGPAVADHYSVARLADRVLAHLGLA